MVTNSTGVVSVSLPTVEESHVCMGVFNMWLPSNDGLQSNRHNIMKSMFDLSPLLRYEVLPVCKRMTYFPIYIYAASVV
jgi:hypothetical protein